MVITATNPTEMPPQEEKVYDIYRISFFQVKAPSVTQPVTADAELTKTRTDPVTGIDEDSPVDTPVRFRIPDLFALAATDQEIAQIMGLLIDKVGRMAKEKGLI